MCGQNLIPDKLGISKLQVWSRAKKASCFRTSLSIDIQLKCLATSRIRQTVKHLLAHLFMNAFQCWLRKYNSHNLNICFKLEERFLVFTALKNLHYDTEKNMKYFHQGI